MLSNDTVATVREKSMLNFKRTMTPKWIDNFEKNRAWLTILFPHCIETNVLCSCDEN